LCARSSSLELRPTLACLSKLPLCHRFRVVYSAFLDQCVLSATAPLALTLGEELHASASAILAWSNSYQDSEYYKKEFNYLEGRDARTRAGGAGMLLRSWTERRCWASQKARYLWIFPSDARALLSYLRYNVDLQPVAISSLRRRSEHHDVGELECNGCAGEHAPATSVGHCGRSAQLPRRAFSRRIRSHLIHD
jgi:hypothetical protein